MTKQLGCPLDLAGSLSLGGSLNWCLVSPLYTQLHPELTASWTALLPKLGAHRLLVLQRRQVQLAGKAAVKRSPWSQCAEQLNAAAGAAPGSAAEPQGRQRQEQQPGGWAVDDCSCPDLERLVSGLVSEDEVTKAERLLQHLAQEWGHYRQAFSASARWARCCWYSTALAAATGDASLGPAA
jgi:hypothetical protein